MFRRMSCSQRVPAAPPQNGGGFSALYAVGEHVRSALSGGGRVLSPNIIVGGPTHRGAHYLAQLVEAGHKVGVVRQTETAALKAASEGRSKLFERKVVGVYTKATIGAAGALDLGGAPPEGDFRGSSYLVTVVEEASTSAGAQLALVAVECATGEVVCGAFRDGPLRSTLEAHLLVLQPGEVVLASAGGGALSGASEKLVRGLCGGGGGGGQAARIERADTREFEHGGALAECTQFYGGGAGRAVGCVRARIHAARKSHSSLAVRNRQPPSASMSHRRLR